MNTPTIRSESPRDFDAIREVTRLAFDRMPFADGDEHKLADALRDAGALAISLVAEINGQVIGHVAFSIAFPEDGSPGWYALGPVSVHPEFQRSGVGSALIRKGLEEIEIQGGCGCILTGDPSYYSRFGFQLNPLLVPHKESAEHFMIKQIGEERTTKPISFHAAFYGEG